MGIRMVVEIVDEDRNDLAAQEVWEETVEEEAPKVVKGRVAPCSKGHRRKRRPKEL